MHWVSGTVALSNGSVAAERQGCNSLVFAIESTDGAWHGVLKGALPTGPGGLYYDAVMQKQQQDWLLPAILGDRRRTGSSDGMTMQGHSNVLPVLHSFMGSSQLLVPWLGWINDQAGAFRRRTTWIVTERFPTTLRGAARKCWEVGGRLSGRQVGLWLLQVLQGLEHARSRGVVHRDVKADNVFLTADGRAVIGDWGEGMLLYTGGLSVAVDHTLRGLMNLHQIDVGASRGASSTAGPASPGVDADLDRLEEDPVGVF